MFKKLKFISLIISFLFISLNLSLASAPLIIEYEFIEKNELLIQTKNIINKKAGEKINMVYDEILMECQVRRINDFYGIRQFRCFVPCVPFIDSQDGDCYLLENREDNFFIISINLENPKIIGAQFNQGEYSYQIETKNENGDILQSTAEAEEHNEYFYYLSKYKKIINLENTSTIIDKPEIESTTINNSVMYNNLKGQILLQVESVGEAYYINPTKMEMFFLGRPNDAFAVMREQGVGISNSDLAKIPVSLDYLSGHDSSGDGLPDDFKVALGLDVNSTDSDGDGYSDYEELLHGYNPLGPGRLNHDLNFAKSQAGRILLQVEQNGEAWYVSPENNKRYFLGRPADAFAVMRNLGLGISNENLEKIAIYQPNLSNETVLDCIDKNDALCVQSYLDLFEKRLINCELSSGTVVIGFEIFLGIYRKYDILGYKDDICQIDFWLLEHDDIPESLLNKKMSCEYSEADLNIETVADGHKCEGELKVELKLLENIVIN